MRSITHLSHFERRAKLAEGGFCEVWLAVERGELGMERWVAIKTLRDEWRDDAAMTRAMVAEARLTSLLRHPNLTTLVCFGRDRDSGALFYVMPYIPGRALSTFAARARELTKGPLDPVVVAYIGECILRALGALHRTRDARGRAIHPVHRDVSPENIQVGYRGAITLLDLGLASSTLRARDTPPGRVRGKPQYMAPEQARGEPDLDARVDVFAAGLILHWLLSGSEPYPAETERALAAARAGRVRPLLGERAVPEPLARLVDSMVRADRDERPSDASALARALRTWRRCEHPAYESEAFGAFSAAVLEREHRAEIDLLRSLGSSTQIIRDEEAHDGDRGAAAPRADELTDPIELTPEERAAGGGRSMDEIFEELEDLYRE